MEALIGSHDWGASPLGPPGSWPRALRSAASLVLGSRFAMFLAWGPELGLVYNDAGSVILGDKHPAALGTPLRQVWTTIWDDIGPLIRRALAGDATYSENLHLTIDRFGYRESATFTFSFSPVREDDGSVVGLLAVVAETTEQVLNGQRLRLLLELGDGLRPLTDPVEVAATAARMIGGYLQVARAGYGEIDHAQESVLVRQDWTDGRVASLAGEARILDAFGPAVIEELRAGRTLVVQDCLADPRAGEAFAATWASIGTRSLIVVPLVKDGRLQAIFYLHEPQPRRWSEAEAAIARDVAERTWDAVERSRAELARRQSESRLQLAMDAGRMAVWEHDTATDSITGSPELNRILGYPEDATLDLAELRTRYYSGDRDRLAAVARGTLDRGERFFEAEHRFFGPDGRLRWLLMRAEMLVPPGLDLPTRTIGVVLDVTGRKEAEEALRERESELRNALEAGSLAIFDFDHVMGRMNPSARLSELYGYPPEHVLTLEDIRARYHPDDVEQIWRRRDSHNEDPSIRHFEWTLRLLLPDRTIRWLNGRGEYLRDGSGRIVRSRGVVMDISERKRWEEHQQLLINELNHRVKNTLATVQSITSQTLRNAPTTDEAKQALESRLFALSRAHDVLTRENWEGAGLVEIIWEALSPYRHEREDRLRMEGPDVRLSPRMALAIAMALQELATNAVKYGALSNQEGKLRITWSLLLRDGEERLRLIWRESGGPPVNTPQRRGFGTRLIERSLAQDLRGLAEIRFDPAGVVCTLDAPLN